MGIAVLYLPTENCSTLGLGAGEQGQQSAMGEHFFVYALFLVIGTTAAVEFEQQAATDSSPVVLAETRMCTLSKY